MISTGIIISVRSIPRLLRTNSLSHDSTFHVDRNLSKIVLQHNKLPYISFCTYHLFFVVYIVHIGACFAFIK